MSVVGLVVRISAFQADGPGSIPGQRTLLSSALPQGKRARCLAHILFQKPRCDESRYSLAVERLLRKQKVVGSIPIVGFVFHLQDAHSPKIRFPEKTLRPKALIRASLAQRLERSAVNRKVVGSIPTGGVFDCV